MAKSRKKIGIMGGTFDPIHLGHLMLAEKTYEQLGLDQILFLPAGNPPHKRNRKGCASDEERVEMVRRAIEGNSHFTLSLIEMNVTGYTYTYRTLENLKEKNPDTDYYFIIGADSLFNFSSWREPKRICDACTLVVAARDHATAWQLQAEMNRLSGLYGGHFILLDTVNVDISSQQLRQWCRIGHSLRQYVPDSVAAYIEEHNLYRIADLLQDTKDENGKLPIHPWKSGINGTEKET